jgi:hypothetical protein
MELSDGVKQGRRRDRFSQAEKLFRHARPLQVRMSEAMGHDVLGTVPYRNQCGPWWTFSASRLGDQPSTVALTTKGPNVSVLTHVECSIGAPPLGDPR